MVVGSVIGSAIFMLPAIVAPYGGLGLVSLGAAAIGAMLVAMTFADLSRRVAHVGGPYAYARAGFGDFAGFLMAWGYWIAIWTACAAITIAFTAYLGALILPLGASPTLSVGAGLLLVWGLVAINIRGVREVAIVGLATTVLKLLPLAFIGAVGLFFVESSTLPPMNPTADGSLFVFASTFALTFWTFTGMEGVTVPTEDVINPEKTIPRALILGTLTVGVIYLLVTFAVMGLVPATELAVSPSPLTDAGVRIAGSWAGVFVSVGALISTLGALNYAILIAGQTAMAAARDGVFPDRFQRLTRYHTPGFSFIAAGLLTSVLLIMNYTKGMVGAYRFVLLIATVTIVVPYAFAAMAALVLEMSDRAAGRTRRLREGVVAVLAFLVCMWVIASSGAETVYWGFLLLMAGIPVYVVVTRDRHKKGGDAS